MPVELRPPCAARNIQGNTPIAHLSPRGAAAGDDLETQPVEQVARNSPAAAKPRQIVLVARHDATTTRNRSARHRSLSRHIRPRAAAFPAPPRAACCSSSKQCPAIRLLEATDARLVAPVKAPTLRWTNALPRIRVSARRAVRSSPAARPARRKAVSRSAISVLARPRSPITSTGRFIACGTAGFDRRRERRPSWPMNWLSPLHGHTIVKFPNAWQ